MLSASRRPRVGRRATLGLLLLLSTALHLTLLAALLLIPSNQPQTGLAGPLSVDLVAEDSSAGAASALPDQTGAEAAPVDPAPPVQQAETLPPAPAPEPTPAPAPAPPVQQAETPPPTPEVSRSPPAQQVQTSPPEAATAETVPPSPPVNATKAAPPTPAPALPPPPVPPAQPMPAPSERAAARPATVHSTPPPRALSRRAVARPAAAEASADPAGVPGQAKRGQSSASRAGDANNGAAWMGRLKQWWDQHSFYPKQASQTNEGGSVKVHMSIAPDGQVTSIEVVQGSGSSVLDAAAAAVFRDAHLPPFPPGTPAQPADVVVTLHYRPANSGE